MRKESRDQEKQLHAESMAEVLEPFEDPKGVHIHDRPGVTIRTEGFSGVKKHAEQECKAPQRIEGMEAPGSGGRRGWLPR